MIRAICLLLCGFCAQAYAQNITRFDLLPTQNPADIKGTIVVAPTYNRTQSCGVKLDFGDGTPAQVIEVPVNQPVAFTHTYTSTGIFPITAKGEGVTKFLSALQPCGGQGMEFATVLGQAQIDDGSLDIMLLVRTKANRYGTAPYFASNLDGTAKLVELKNILCVNTALLAPQKPEQFKGNLYRDILESQQLSVLAGSELYKQAKLTEIQKIVTDQFEATIKSMGHAGNAQHNCAANLTAPRWSSLEMLGNADVVAVPKILLPSLQKIRAFADIQTYTPLYALSFQQARQIAQANQQKDRQIAQLKTNTVDEFNLMAQSNSKDKVGSLILGTARALNKNLQICTLSYKDQDGATVLGYRGLNFNMLLPDMRDRFAKEGYNIGGDGQKPFDKTFDNLNDAYVEISRQPDICHIFIDYPNNLATLDAGFKRDKNINSNLGALMDSTAAREQFATQRGYDNYTDFKFAKSISGNAQDIKKLKAAGIHNKTDFDALVLEMQQLQYAKAEDLNTIYMYLNDKDQAKTKKLSVVAQRDARLAEEKKKREQDELDRQRRKEAFAKEFPYEAVISCGFQGQHMTLVACFAGGQYGVGTELEIRNGGKYGLYKAHELYSLGQERSGEGLILPLKSNFEIKAQNSNETLTLSVLVRETASGKVLFTKSAARFGVVRVSN